MKILILVCMFFLNPSLFANFRQTPKRLIKKYNLQPLVESEEWKKNPGILPYEKCVLIREEHPWGVSMAHEAQIGVGKGSYNGTFSFFCFSKKKKIGFQIPFEFKNDRSVGFRITLNAISRLRGRLTQLDGKTLQDFYGSYKGMGAGIGLFTNIGRSVLYNHGIKFLMKESLGFFVFDIGIDARKLELHKRDLVFYEYLDRFYLYSYQEIYSKAQASLSDCGFDTEACIEKYRKELEKNKAEHYAKWDMNSAHRVNWKYWIHHIKNNSEESLHCLENCIDHSKLTLSLEDSFLSSLTFQKVD